MHLRFFYTYISYYHSGTKNSGKTTCEINASTFHYMFKTKSLQIKLECINTKKHITHRSTPPKEYVNFGLKLMNNTFLYESIRFSVLLLEISNHGSKLGTVKKLITILQYIIPHIIIHVSHNFNTQNLKSKVTCYEFDS